jgi:hypothetical protein
MTSTPSAITWLAASAMVLRPEEQKRLTVEPEVVIGMPASSATWRPRLPAPCATLPMITSSIAAGSRPDLATACFTAWAPIDMVGVMLNPPRPDLARPVRA